jgi:hypothetical protein
MASDGWADRRSITAARTRLSETACRRRLAEPGLFAGQRVCRRPPSMRRDSTVFGSSVLSHRMWVSRDNVLSFLPMNLARLASSATQPSPIRRQLSSACALMQAGGRPGTLAGLQPEQSSSAQATRGHYLKRAKRAPWPPWIVNEDSSPQVISLVQAIFVVTGQWAPQAWTCPSAGLSGSGGSAVNLLDCSEDHRRGPLD